MINYANTLEEGTLVLKKIAKKNKEVLFKFNINVNVEIISYMVGISGFLIAYTNRNSHNIPARIECSCKNITKINKNTIKVEPYFAIDGDTELCSEESFIYITCIIYYSKLGYNRLHLNNLEANASDLINYKIDKCEGIISGFCVQTKENSDGLTDLRINSNTSINSPTGITTLIKNNGSITANDISGGFVEQGYLGISNDSMNYYEIYNGHGNNIDYEFNKEISDYAFFIKNISFKAHSPRKLGEFFCNFNLDDNFKLNRRNLTAKLNSSYYSSNELVTDKDYEESYSISYEPESGQELDIEYTILGIHKYITTNTIKNYPQKIRNESYSSTITCNEDLGIFFLANNSTLDSLSTYSSGLVVRNKRSYSLDFNKTINFKQEAIKEFSSAIFYDPNTSDLVRVFFVFTDKGGVTLKEGEFYENYTNVDFFKISAYKPEYHSGAISIYKNYLMFSYTNDKNIISGILYKIKENEKNPNNIDLIEWVRINKFTDEESLAEHTISIIGSEDNINEITYALAFSPPSNNAYKSYVSLQIDTIDVSKPGQYYEPKQKPMQTDIPFYVKAYCLFQDKDTLIVTGRDGLNLVLYIYTFKIFKNNLSQIENYLLQELNVKVQRLSACLYNNDLFLLVTEQYGYSLGNLLFYCGKKFKSDYNYYFNN